MLRGKGLLTPIQRAFLAAFATLPDSPLDLKHQFQKIAKDLMGHITKGGNT